MLADLVYLSLSWLLPAFGLLLLLGPRWRGGNWLLSSLYLLLLLGLGMVVWSGGENNLKLGMLPWEGAALTKAIVILGAVGLLCVLSAILGKFRWLFFADQSISLMQLNVSMLHASYLRENFTLDPPKSGMPRGSKSATATK